MLWEGLNPPYATIVADPPWHYDERVIEYGRGNGAISKPMPYSTMSLEEVTALPVGELAALNAHLYLWTTNRYLEATYDIARSWGFDPRQTLVWCKPPHGLGPGGAFANTAEFVVFARRGTLAALERAPSTWWVWNRGSHSTKPAGFLDVVERVSPAPRIELFARAPRLGWDSWGYGYETEVAS